MLSLLCTMQQPSPGSIGKDIKVAVSEELLPSGTRFCSRVRDNSRASTGSRRWRENEEKGMTHVVTMATRTTPWPPPPQLTPANQGVVDPAVL